LGENLLVREEKRRKRGPAAGTETMTRSDPRKEGKTSKSKRPSQGRRSSTKKTKGREKENPPTKVQRCEKGGRKKEYKDRPPSQDGLERGKKTANSKGPTAS